MPETQDDLEELVPLRVAAIRSVQDKCETVEEMLAQADNVLAYYKYGERIDLKRVGDREETGSFSL